MSIICFQASVVEDTHKDLLNAGELANYLRRDIQYCQLKNYDLTYALYSKFPSWGMLWWEPRHRSGCISHSLASETFSPSFLYFLFFLLLSAMLFPFSAVPRSHTPTLSLRRRTASFKRADPSFSVVFLCLSHHHHKKNLFHLVLPSDLILFCWWRTKIS